MPRIKGGVAGLVALIACPCHLPLTLPALLLLTGGTGVGVWLAANQWYIWLASFLLFAGGLGLAFFWFGQTTRSPQCESPRQVQKSALTTDASNAGRGSEFLALTAQTKETPNV